MLFLMNLSSRIEHLEIGLKDLSLNFEKHGNNNNCK
jgi:hypothetical protein